MASKLGAVMRAGRREDANQGPTSKRADGRKMTDVDAEREGAGSRKVGSMSREEAQAVNMPRANAAGPGRLGEMMRPSSILPPVNSREEYDERVAQNERWAMAPETQAALLQFAVSIMQPVGGTGGAGDFIGAVGRSFGEATGAASRVREGTLEEDKYLREEGRAERRLDLEERQFNAAERRLSSEEVRLARQLGLDEKRLTLEERKLVAELRKGTAQKIIINSDSPLNTQFNLGIPEGEDATVEVTRDSQTGNISNASVTGGFGEGKSTQKLESLLDLMDEAIDNGDSERAQIYYNAAMQESQQFSLTAGEELNTPLPESLRKKLPPTSEIPGAIPSIPGDPSSPPAAIPQSSELTLKPIAGGKIDRERQAQKAIEDAQKNSDRQTGVLVGTAVDTINKTIQESIAPNLLITGGIGSLLSILPHESDSRTVAKALDTITSNVGFDSLQKMREASPTGAALGPVSDTENKLLQSTLASLDQFRDKDIMLKDLLTIKFLFDPQMKEVVGQINKQANDGVITEEAAVNQFNRLLDEYVYPPELNEPPALDWTTPPAYLSAEDAELWSKLEPAEKILFFDDNDRRRAMGAQ